jgi:hypothetical protein
MSVTLDATVGGASSNTYCTEAEATAYFNARVPLATPWDEVEDPTAALAMAARVLDALAQARTYRQGDKMITTKAWTGSPATTTQRMAWPRIGMYDANGNAIPSTVIPIDLKNAQAELAGQLSLSDTTLDNAATVQGIKSVKAGSVSIDFKDMIEKHVLPDSVWWLLPASWLTDEIYASALSALFDVVSE